MNAKSDSWVLGGGCFWCLEALFKRVNGILGVSSGYSGGSTDNPSYEEVCAGDTGHAEVVEVSFDPDKLSSSDILRLFFHAHDPTTLNRQGDDIGSQYRSVIFYNKASQREVAEAAIKEAQEEHRGKVVTELKPLDRFWPAEEYHKDYFDSHRQASYCRLVIQPKLEKLQLL
jgi:peptide-methionine (S)-S-oxide reductase